MMVKTTAEERVSRRGDCDNNIRRIYLFLPEKGTAMEERVEFVNGPADGDTATITDEKAMGQPYAHIQSKVRRHVFYKYERTDRVTDNGAVIYEYLEAYESEK